MEISTRYQETLEHLQEIFALAGSVKEHSGATRLHSQRLVTDRALETKQLAETCLTIDRATDEEALRALQSGIRHLERKHKRRALLAPLRKARVGIGSAAQGVLEGMTLGLWRE